MNIFKIILHIKVIIYRILLKLTFGDCLILGKGVIWRNNFSIRIKGGQVTIGNGCFFNNNCSIASIKSVTIGDNSIFGENVKIYDHNHVFSDKNKLIKDQGYSEEAICIGENCWIGSNVVILKGTQIGEGSVIGAGIVVFGNIPPFTVIKNQIGNYIFEKRR